MNHLRFSIILLLLLGPQCVTQAQESTIKANPTPTVPVVSSSSAIPLADVITQADAAEMSLEETPASISSDMTATREAQDFPSLVQEINARLVETNELVGPGAQFETLRDLESQWEKLAERLVLWTRDLSNRANVVDKKVAILPDLRATWTKTLELAQAPDTPEEIRQRIEKVLATLKRTENIWQKKRATILSEQSRVAEQRKRVAGAITTIRAAQTAAVSRLFVQDTPPIWHSALLGNSTQKVVAESKTPISGQFLRLRAFADRQAMRFVYLGIIFCCFAMVLFWVRHAAAKWTDRDPVLESALRVLQVPVAMAALLTILVCPPSFDQPPRIFWAILATLALFPITVVLRRLIDQTLYPVLNALLIFFVIAQIRKVSAAAPEFSRLLLLLEMVGGSFFLIWFIHSTRRDINTVTSHKVARAAARFGLLLFTAIFLANVFGYFRLANFLSAGSLSAAYTAILLYAASVSLTGLFFFALRVRPLMDLRLINRHRTLLQGRFTGILYFVAIIVWTLLMLEQFSLRTPIFDWVIKILKAQLNYQSLHLSLGAVLAFVFAIWIAAMLSRLIRFVLEEDIYGRFHVAAGSSYAASTLLHYVILMGGVFVAIAALGVDMSKFTVLVGALGVGIGFGLQNIINNFVSGLILLFERPVNVGDVVQVGDATGIIQHIGIRASIIRIANSSELIVPNSQLISEKVTNWTLTNRQRRIELQVGVAYGTDPKRVIELLTSVAAAHPLASKTPAPQTLMSEFGPSSLNFDVRLWTDEYDRWLQIKSDVAVAINNALVGDNIAISFPQLDLHLQTINPEIADLLRSSQKV